MRPAQAFEFGANRRAKKMGTLRLAHGFALACVIVAQLACGSTAIARVQARQYDFHIDESRLGAALNELARQSGVLVLYPYQLANAAGMNPVNGRHTIREAYQILLHGTGFSGGLTDNGVLTISRNNTHGGKDMPKSKNTTGLLSSISAIALGVLSAAPSYAQTATRLQEVVVTAQKRQQSADNVGMSITALTRDELETRGITDVRDLTKVVSGFNYSESDFGTPVYTLRGVGLNDSGLASVPAVAIYEDQIPLPFPVMTEAVGLDLKRVEVLEGPQGTLFGQNSTGGAINYIAAKPTNELSAGMNASIDNFGLTDLSGFVSGPVSTRVGARLALRSVQGGAWQVNTVTGQKLGDQRKLQGRLTLEAKPTDKLDLRFTATGWRDDSDTRAPQVVALWIGGPGSPNIAGLPGGATDPLLQQPLNAQTKDPQAASWHPGWPMRQGSRFWQVALTGNYHFTDQLTLTSITSYDHMNYSMSYDPAGTVVQDLELARFGKIQYVYQELRLAYDTARFHGLIGGDYGHADVKDRTQYHFEGSSAAGVTGPPFFLPNRLSLVQSSADQTHQDWAVFAHGDYDITDNFSAIGGIRYNDFRLDGFACTRDLSANQAATQLLSIISGYTIAPGHCYQINDITNGPPGGLRVVMNERSVSWHAGLNYRFDGGTLFYASFSRGYKGGVLTNITTTTQSESDPAKQERVDAYETGFKAPLFGHRLQLNGAVFYYDYSDKQVLGRVLTFYGLLNKLINVPQSRIIGQEVSIRAVPFTGLRLSGSFTHLDSEVTKNFFTYNGQSQLENIKGSALPFTPDWSANLDVQYSWPIFYDNLAFVGAGLTYHGANRASFQTAAAPAPLFSLPVYTLLDLRAGIESGDGRWKVELFGHNVTNKYYFDTTYASLDTFVRYAGHPATWGMQVSYHF